MQKSQHMFSEIFWQEAEGQKEGEHKQTEQNTIPTNMVDDKMILSR